MLFKNYVKSCACGYFCREIVQKCSIAFLLNTTINKESVRKDTIFEKFPSIGELKIKHARSVRIFMQIVYISFAHE
jgi:hypothetical protein